MTSALETSSLALLVIDMQLCAFDGELLAPIDEGRGLLDTVKTLILGARQSGVPVVYLQHCAPVAGQPYAKGTHGWEIHPSVAPKSGEVIVFKSQSNGFAGTDLEQVLASSGIGSVILCGIQSEHCVTNTGLSALEPGLNVLVVQDAHGTVSTVEERASDIIDRQNALLSEKGVELWTVAETLALLSHE